MSSHSRTGRANVGYLVGMSVVVCIPGAAESEHSFRDLTPRWSGNIVPAFHNIAGLTGEAPLEGYSWQDEVDRLDAQLRQLAPGPVYLLGMSGGATLTLAYLADHPGTIAGIGLIEPAWSFVAQSAVEKRYYAELDRVLQLPPAQQRDAFVRLVSPGVQLPPVTATAARGYQQANRPADTAIAVVTRAMQAHRVDPERLASFSGPAYLAIGGRSSPMWPAQASQLKTVLPQLVIETYPDRHHLDSPHHAEAQRLVDSLLAAWQIG